MQKNELYRNGDLIVRILALNKTSALIIDCIKKTMPTWVDLSALNEYVLCSENYLLHSTSHKLEDAEQADKPRQATMHKRFTMIASVLPFIEDPVMRSDAIVRVSEEYSISPQTVRKYLCLFLTYQTVSALLPPLKPLSDKPLSSDEKCFRWALNKFYYSRKKHSLRSAYTLMLQSVICRILLPKGLR